MKDLTPKYNYLKSEIREFRYSLEMILRMMEDKKLEVNHDFLEIISSILAAQDLAEQIKNKVEKHYL